MNHKQRLLLTIAGGVMLAGLIVIGMAVLAATAVRADTSNATLRIDMTLIGDTQLEWATVGKLDDVLTPPVTTDPDVLNDLGELALGFWLEDQSTGNDVVLGYVDLTNTLVFTKEWAVDTTTPTTATVTVRDAGPAVNGTFDGSSLTLLSERFNFSTQAGQAVERQFRLIGTGTRQLVTGEYRETIWGYSLEPVTIVGTFTLRIYEGATGVPTAVTTRGLTTGTASLALLAGLLVLVGGVTLLAVRRRGTPTHRTSAQR